jgi:serine protease
MSYVAHLKKPIGLKIANAPNICSNNDPIRIFACLCKRWLLLQGSGEHFTKHSNKMPVLRITLLLFLCQLYLPAQDLGRGWLVSLPKAQDVRTLCVDFGAENKIAPASAELLSADLNAWLLTHPTQESALGTWLARRREVLHIQHNDLVQLRSIDTLPNDPLLANQWHHQNLGGPAAQINADLDSDLAWDQTRGGVTPTGDTIVVAVVDGGLANHPDIVQNLWVNHGEIPNDGLDNDQNGYIDDVRGWNFYGNNNEISGNAVGHGTPVSALIAARGNNGIGISGVNWHVKVMFVAGGGDVARILKSYDYILQARKRYNSSFGQSGAFVVATNSSFGINNGQPANQPLWCAMYDSLGHAGILNAAATANSPVDVDVVGDLPTACPSDYLVSVTSMTKLETKAADAAWGANHIDLGAYGDAVYTTDASSGYALRSGTSFATPLVSGAIALLYAAPCPNLIGMAKANPASAALLAKSVLLSSTTPVPGLQGKTVSGGRLNLNTMLKEYESGCSPCPAPIITMVQGTDKHGASVTWASVSPGANVTFRWRKVGAPDWQLIENPSNNILLGDLESCTAYEAQMKAACGGGLTSDWSPVVSFSTLGCCAPPLLFPVTLVTEQAATFHWSSDGTNAFVFRWRTDGGLWEQILVNAPPYTISTLKPCTEYEYQVAVKCGDLSLLDFSESAFFTTAGCGSCLDAAYCAAKAENASEEWIAAVSLGPWSHETAPSGEGYQNLTQSLLLSPSVVRGETYPVQLKPGFLNGPLKEYFRVFIDFNQDGDFADAAELAFDPGFASEAAVNGSIFVPADATPGMTRMRVLMRYSQNNISPPAACGVFTYGQVEDYCLQIVENAVNTEEEAPAAATFRLFPNPTEGFFTLLREDAADAASMFVTDVLGREVYRTADLGTALQVDAGNWSPGIYLLCVQSAGKTVVLRVCVE